jgi:hypothetical protein
MHHQFLQHLLITHPLSESSDNGGIRDARYNPPYLGEAADESPESLPEFLPQCMEMSLHTMLLISTGEVCCKPRTELLPGVDRPRDEVHEPGPGRPGQGYMEVACHYDCVSTSCCNGGDVDLQELRRVYRTVILLRQVWPELGWPSRRAEMICKCGTAHTDQRDTRLDSGVPCSEILVEVATLEVLSALTRLL